MKELIRKLTEVYGPSGHEDQVRRLILEQVQPLSDEVRVDALGNLIVLKHSSGQGKKVMLAAHMDEIGLIVSYVDDRGFLRFQPIGGIDLTTLVGSRVQFSDGQIGVIAPEDRREFKEKPELHRLFIDVGATNRQEAQVRLGQAACFVRPLVDLGNRVLAKALDDRIGCAVLIETLRRLTASPHDLCFVFSVQEEVGLRGARTSAYGVEPDLGIAVDITLAADTPEHAKMAMKLGAGPCIKVMDSGMLAHPAVKAHLVASAEAHGIPYQLEVLDRGTTDAAAMQLARAGVLAGCISVPTRYYHTPSEMVDLADVEDTVRLLIAALTRPIDL